MQKQTFIEKLRHFAKVEGRGIRDEYGHNDYRPWRGENVLARMIATFLERPCIEDLWPEENWFLKLPNILVEAFEAFRTEPAFLDGRLAYAHVMDGREIPNLVDVQAGGLHRVLVAHGIARLMSVLSGEGEWLKGALQDRFEGQMQEIKTAWSRFVRVAYAKLIRRVNAEAHRGNSGNSGIFGTTKLMTWACAGRVSFTFKGPEGTMTCVADDADPTGESSSPNAPGAPWQACVNMINEVTDHWDIDKLQRDDAIGIRWPEGPST